MSTYGVFFTLEELRFVKSHVAKLSNDRKAGQRAQQLAEEVYGKLHHTYIVAEQDETDRLDRETYNKAKRRRLKIG